MIWDESPKVQVKSVNQNTPQFASKDTEHKNHKRDGQGFTLLKVPFLKYEEEKSGILGDPETLMDKASELLDHYKNAY